MWTCGHREQQGQLEVREEQLTLRLVAIFWSMLVQGGCMTQRTNELGAASVTIPSMPGLEEKLKNKEEEQQLKVGQVKVFDFDDSTNYWIQVGKK